MSNPESRLHRQIMKALGDEFPGSYFRKIHGNAFQHAGIPDIIGCVEGYFVGLEVKTDTGKSTMIQILEGQSIKKASGIHGEVRSPEEAIKVIKEGLNSIWTE